MFLSVTPKLVEPFSLLLANEKFCSLKCSRPQHMSRVVLISQLKNAEVFRATSCIKDVIILSSKLIITSPTFQRKKCWFNVWEDRKVNFWWGQVEYWFWDAFFFLIWHHDLIEVIHSKSFQFEMVFDFPFHKISRLTSVENKNLKKYKLASFCEVPIYKKCLKLAESPVLLLEIESYWVEMWISTWFL